MIEGKIRLFRAVRPAELADLVATGRFSNPVGIEAKYFSTSRDGAVAYAALAGARFRDGPYTLVTTRITERLIEPMFRVNVDGGIPAIVIPTEVLGNLDTPTLLEVP